MSVTRTGDLTWVPVNKKKEIEEKKKRKEKNWNNVEFIHYV